MPRTLDNRGSVTVLTAVFMVVLIGMLALVVDAGIAFQERRQVRTACDAGSLAAAQELAEGGSEAAATSIANEYVSANTNVTPDSIDVTFPSQGLVKVAARTTREAVFSKIFALQELVVGGSATAKYGAASTTIGVAPFVVPYQMIGNHVGEANAGAFELGSDAPAAPFRKTSVAEGSTVQYKIEYINTSPNSKEITIRDPIPSGGEYVDGSAGAGGTFNGTEVSWTKALAPDEQWEVGFTVNKTGASVARNTAYARGTTGPEESAAENDEAQRGFFWLANFSGAGAGESDYANWILNGYQQDVSVDQVASGTGMKVGLKDALEQRMLTDPSIIVPLFDYTEGSGSQGEYHIKGFAEFVITDVSLTGNPKTMSGYFTTGTLVPGSTGGGGLDYGVSAVGLVD